jgi:hypothetical protein
MMAFPNGICRMAHFQDLREQTTAFVDLAAYAGFSKAGDEKLSGDGEPARLSSIRVSQKFFSLLGAYPLLGREFTADECKWNGPAAMLLSYGLWQRRYASDPGIVGRQVTLNDRSATIVGVMPASFDFASVFAPGTRADLYLPMPLTAETNRWGNTLAVIGSIAPSIP